MPNGYGPDPYVLDPQAAPQPTIFDQANSWLQDPGNRAALLQFGAMMMQPVGVGQSFWGHVGQGLAGAGAAKLEAEKFDIADEERRRKADLEERKVSTEETRTAGLTDYYKALGGAATANAAGGGRAGLSSMIQAQRLRMAQVAGEEKFVKDRIAQLPLAQQLNPSPAIIAEFRRQYQEFIGQGIDPNVSSPAAAIPGAGPAPSAPAPAGVPPTGTAAGMPQPKSKAEFDALPSGTEFMAPDGTVRRKP